MLFLKLNGLALIKKALLMTTLKEPFIVFITKNSLSNGY